MSRLTRRFTSVVITKPRCSFTPHAFRAQARSRSTFHLTENDVMNESLNHEVEHRSTHTYYPETEAKSNLTTKNSGVFSNDKTWKPSSSSHNMKELAEELHLLFQKSDEERKLAMEEIERSHKHDMEMLAREEQRNEIDMRLAIVSLAAAIASLVFSLLTVKPEPYQISMDSNVNKKT